MNKQKYMMLMIAGLTHFSCQEEVSINDAAKSQVALSSSSGTISLFSSSSLADPTGLGSSSSTGDISQSSSSTVGAQSAQAQSSQGTQSSSSATLQAYTYTKDVAPIMAKYCTSCHGTSGGINLESYAKVKEFAEASISSIEAGTMPKGRSVSPAELSVLKSWFANNMPQ